MPVFRPKPARSTQVQPGTSWTEADLSAIDACVTVDVATRRGDGTLRGARAVWIVRYRDAVYVRSGHGINADWYRGARALHEGQLTAGGVDHDVRFVEMPSTPVPGSAGSTARTSREPTASKSPGRV